MTHDLVKQHMRSGSQTDGSARVAVTDLIYGVRGKSAHGIHRFVVNRSPFQSHVRVSLVDA